GEHPQGDSPCGNETPALTHRRLSPLQASAETPVTQRTLVAEGLPQQVDSASPCPPQEGQPWQDVVCSAEASQGGVSPLEPAVSLAQQQWRHSSADRQPQGRWLQEKEAPSRAAGMGKPTTAIR